MGQASQVVKLLFQQLPSAHLNGKMDFYTKTFLAIPAQLCAEARLLLLSAVLSPHSRARRSRGCEPCRAVRRPRRPCRSAGSGAQRPRQRGCEGREGAARRVGTAAPQRDLRGVRRCDRSRAALPRPAPAADMSGDRGRPPAGGSRHPETGVP